jgi:hypothetical protein
MPKLFVLGDSFSFPHEGNDQLWPIIAAKKLEASTNQQVEIVNRSLIGASQDYVWKMLSSVINEITPDDFLIIILTSCDRFWYFEERPEYSNLLSTENITQTTNDPELQKTLLGFITRIWRPSLAKQHQDHRLGYLCYHTLKKKLRPPLILKAFEHVISNEEKFPDLIFSNHCLAKIQLEEFEKFSSKFTGSDILLDNKYWHHIDCRYNHMCLSNHGILGDIIANSLITATMPDLSSDMFYKSIITEKNCKDKDFAAKEFYLRYFNEMLNNSLRQKLGAKSFKLTF